MLYMVEAAANLTSVQRVIHLYLILRIEIQDTEKEFGTRLWARCERHAPSGPNASLVARLRDFGHEALDTIYISDDSSSLHQRGNERKPRFQRLYRSLTMLHVVDLLHGMHVAYPRYSLHTHSCWWFSATIISVLDMLGAELSINAGKDILTLYLKIFSQDATKVTREIAQLYALKWFPGEVPVKEKLGPSDIWVDGHTPPNVGMGSIHSSVTLSDTLPVPLSGITLESPFPVKRGSYSVVFKGLWESQLVALKLLNATDTPEIAHKVD